MTRTNPRTADTAIFGKTKKSVVNLAKKTVITALSKARQLASAMAVPMVEQIRVLVGVPKRYCRKWDYPDKERGGAVSNV